VSPVDDGIVLRAGLVVLFVCVDGRDLGPLDALPERSPPEDIT
jgi:hypothetical protein